MKSFLSKLKTSFFKWLYRYLHVQSYISILSFVMLLILVSDKTANFLNLHFAGFTFVFVAFAMVAILLAGWFLIEVVKAPLALEKEQIAKSAWQRRMEEKLDKLMEK